MTGPAERSTSSSGGGEAGGLPGVTVGEEAVVGAGSVVTKDVPPRTAVVGAPAGAVRQLAEGGAGGGDTAQQP